MKKYLYKIFDALKNRLNYLNYVDIVFNVPQSSENGDYSTNAAMVLAKRLKKNPRSIAQDIINNLDFDSNIINKIEIAGPGFINFYFSHKFAASVIKEILAEDNNFGKFDSFSNKKAIVEFVSANPTGPLTVGHGRNAVLGDTIANMLEWIGYKVTREYYFNNAGRQMRVLGESVKARYLELLGKEIEFPDEYYQGNYIIDIAEKLFEEYGNSIENADAETIFKEKAEEEIFLDIQNTLKKLNIKFDKFFNEKSLYENGNIERVLKVFKEKSLSYIKDDAVWLKLSELGQEQDKVIIKSTGEPTYRLPDIAYHAVKFDRKYDLIVDIFGSDHNATFPDVLAGVEALGYNKEKVRVIIHQFVTIMQNGKVVKMSTRKANFITLEELIDEVGKDVVRYFFNMRNYSSHMNFDLDLAKKHSDENPVFYLQYAHARISSILRMTKEENLHSSVENLDLLEHPYEQSLLKYIARFPEEVYYAALNYEPHKIANYLESLAAQFHKFYTECRIIGSGKDLAGARIALIIAVQIVLRNGLAILGVEAPDKM